MYRSFRRWLQRLVHPVRSASSPRPRACRPAVEALEERAVPAVITVTSYNDDIAPDGVVSLREAIESANTDSNMSDVVAVGNYGNDTIKFNIPGQTLHTIKLDNLLPNITDPCTIDGYSQPGASKNPLAKGDNAKLLIEIDGGGLPGDGLRIMSGFCTIQGLVISGFDSSGIFLGGAGSNIIRGNFIGTDANGAFDLGNGQAGIKILSGFNTIGTAATGDRNIISGNNFAGIYISGANAGHNGIYGNYIGTDGTGEFDLGNAEDGIRIDNAPSTEIGYQSQGGNLISGNNGAGILLSGAGTTQTTIKNNIIGLDLSGIVDLGNSSSGIEIINAHDTVIGGTLPSQGNIISGNNNDGITITDPSAQHNKIQGNLIGTDINGTKAVENSQYGVSIQDASNNLIGGLVPEARNVISGNGSAGVKLSGGYGSNLIQGNFIGTDITGTKALGNDNAGIDVFSAGDQIGGADPGAGNVISGHNKNGRGITLRDDATAILIQGNKIGTDVTGTKALGNSTGLSINGSNNTIGGAAPGAGNLISGNTNGGISVGGVAATGNHNQGTSVGTDITGTLPLGNYFGVYVGSANNLVGGTGPGAGNIIAHNAAYGVSVDGTGNAILGNSIFDNQYGISLVGAPMGAANDPQDADTGPNNKQNFPVLTATTTAASTNIAGILNSTPNRTFRMEFFSTPGLDKVGSVEGKTFLGWVNAATDANGDTSFNYAVGKLPKGGLITATATDLATNDTSVFSAPAGTPASFALSDLDHKVYFNVYDGTSGQPAAPVLVAPGQFLSIAAGSYGFAHASVVFGVGSDHQVYRARYDGTGDFVDGWVPVAPGQFQSIAVGSYGANNPILFGIGNASGQVYASIFDSQAQLVAGWFPVAPGVFSALAVGNYGVGNPEVFGIGKNNQVFASRFDSNGAFVNGWFLVAPGAFTSVTVGNHANGTLELFG